MDSINKILANGIEIEPTYAPKRGIVLFRKVDDLLYLSGHGPEDALTNEPIYAGRVGEERTFAEGYEAARECAIILLGAIKDITGNLDKVKRIVKATGLVNCGKDFYDVDKVMDGFSDTMMVVLEERGYHTRTVMGTRNLPNNNITTEIEVIVQIEE
jgi:Putative translation initiation inhibitor, yjgF family